MPWFEHDSFDDSFFDPLQVERSRPVADEEARQWEIVCQTASPGPLMDDDKTDGSGMLVAMLPDGRQLVSTAPTGSALDAMCVAEANAELICHAKLWILRLLRDREHSRQREEMLLARIAKLEFQVQASAEPIVVSDLPPADDLPHHPR
jgi:hypothetical protein